MPDFDFSDVLKLTADFGAADNRLIPFVRKAVERTARNVKDDWADNIRKANHHGSTRRYSYSVDYDLMLDADGSIGAEIGPNRDKKGGRHGFLEEANGDVTAPPQHSGRKAAAKNVADFEAGLLQAGEDALR